MSAVKQSPSFRSCVFVTAGLLALAGCANGDLARFAPPGVVKYEDIAGDKPQNPAVAERIAERQAEKGNGRFPNLSTAPDEQDRPQKREPADIEAEINALVDQRDGLAEEVAADRDASEAELASDLHAESETLKERVEQDSKAAARERREKLAPPAEQK